MTKGAFLWRFLSRLTSAAAWPLSPAGAVSCVADGGALAQCGAKVAILDLKPEMATKEPRRLQRGGGSPKPFACQRAGKSEHRAGPRADQGRPRARDILINGAGGNHPKGTTSKEFLSREDLTGEGGVSVSTILRSGHPVRVQPELPGAFCRRRSSARTWSQGARQIINISSMNAFKPLTKIPGLQRRQGRRQQFHPMARRAFLRRPAYASTPSLRDSSSPTKPEPADPGRDRFSL